MPCSGPAELPGSQLPPKQGARLLSAGRPGRNKGGRPGRSGRRTGAGRRAPRTRGSSSFSPAPKAQRPRPQPWEQHRVLSSSHKLPNSRSPLRMLRGSLSLLKKRGWGVSSKFTLKGTYPSGLQEKLHRVLQAFLGLEGITSMNLSIKFLPEFSICHSLDLFPLAPEP